MFVSRHALAAAGKIALAFFCLTTQPAGAQPTYRVVEIGVLPGDTQSIPHDINDSGEVIGISGSNRLFRWSQSQGMRNPEITVEAPYFFFRQPPTILRINKWGTAVGPNFVQRSNGQVHYRANVCIPSCYVGIGFGGINDNDEVAVTSMTSNTYLSLIYNARTNAYKQDAFNYLWPAYAYAYNNSGMIAGGMFDRRPGSGTGAKVEGFLAKPFPVRITQGQAGVTSEAFDLNSRGETVGQDGGRPFYYDPIAESRVFISTILGSSQSGVAHAINESATVVGSIGIASPRAFIWQVGASTAQYLDDLIDPLDPLRTTTRLKAARAISNNGLIVAQTEANRSVLLVPSVQVVDIVPDLLDGALITQNLDRLSKGGRSIDAVAADGVTKVVFRIRAQRAGQQFLLQVSANGCEGGEIGEVCGKLGLLTSQENSSTFVTATAIDTAGGPMAFAYYLAPKDFSWTSQHRELSYRTVSIDVTTNDSVSALILPIVRPPVAFIHGLWSRKGDLGEMPKLGGKAHLYTVRELNYGYAVGIVSSTPGQSTALLERSPARGSSLGIAHAEDAVMLQLKQYLYDFRLGSNIFGLRIAASQLDLVGHSMGALVSRGITYRSDYKSFDPTTLGKGFVHKIVSVGGPHLGSPLAAEMNASRNACFENWSRGGIWVLGDGLYTFYDCPNCVHASSTQTPGGEYKGSGAIGDLRGYVDGTGRSAVLSGRLTKPSPNPPPVAYISSALLDQNERAFDQPSYVAQRVRGPFDTYVDIKVPNADAPAIKFAAESLCFASSSSTLAAKFASAAAFRSFMSNDTDGLVPIASQLNGINYATYGLPAIPNTAHSSWTSKLYGTLGEKQIPNSQYDFEVALAVKNVLNRPVSDAIYVAK